MKSAHLGLALICLGIGFAASTGLAQDKKDAPLKLGVVDIGLLFQKYERKADMEAAINRAREAMKKEVEAGGNALRRKRLELDKLTKGSPEWQRLAREFKVDNYKLELFTKELQDQLKHRVEADTLMLLRELEAAVSAYGTNRGYTFIFKVDRSNPGGTPADFQDAIFRAQVSSLLHFDAKQVDITKQVLAFLNEPENLERTRKKAKRERRSF